MVADGNRVVQGGPAGSLGLEVLRNIQVEVDRRGQSLGQDQILLAAVEDSLFRIDQGGSSHRNVVVGNLGGRKGHREMDPARVAQVE